MADNTNKMLRAIINGQSAMKSELLGKIGKVDGKIGLSVAQLQEDATAIEEFGKLETRVKKVEQKVAVA